MRPERCAILVPVAHTVEPETEAALRVLANRGYAVRMLRGSSQVDLARSTLATRAMRDGFAETFWIDADTVFEPDDVEKIRAHGKPLTAGLYMRKGQLAFAGKFCSPCATFGVGGGLLEMVYVGMGFTHIRAEVYAKIAKTLPECNGGYDGETVIPYFLPMLVQEGEGMAYLSEDYSFSNRAREAGFKVLADTTIKLGHVGRYTYTWDEFAPRQKIDVLQVGVEEKVPSVWDTKTSEPVLV
jgi:hypothetical protein